jgi:hypothetical protein
MEQLFKSTVCFVTLPLGSEEASLSNTFGINASPKTGTFPKDGGC